MKKVFILISFFILLGLVITFYEVNIYNNLNNEVDSIEGQVIEIYDRPLFYYLKFKILSENSESIQYAEISSRFITLRKKQKGEILKLKIINDKNSKVIKYIICPTIRDCIITVIIIWIIILVLFLLSYKCLLDCN